MDPKHKVTNDSNSDMPLCYGARAGTSTNSHKPVKLFHRLVSKCLPLSCLNGDLFLPWLYWNVLAAGSLSSLSILRTHSPIPQSKPHRGPCAFRLRPATINCPRPLPCLWDNFPLITFQKRAPRFPITILSPKNWLIFWVSKKRELGVSVNGDKNIKQKMIAFSLQSAYSFGLFCNNRMDLCNFLHDCSYRRSEIGLKKVKESIKCKFQKHVRL